MNLNKYPEYESLPFELPDIVSSVKTLHGRKLSILDNETGEVIEGRELATQKAIYRDQANYIKMFPDGVKMIEQLSRKGATLLGFILKRLKAGQVEIELRVSEVMKDHTNLSGGRYYEGLEELLKYGYLVKKKGAKNKFFLNPNYFFNGDRKWIKDKVWKE